MAFSVGCYYTAFAPILLFDNNGSVCIGTSLINHALARVMRIRFPQCKHTRFMLGYPVRTPA